MGILDDFSREACFDGDQRALAIAAELGLEMPLASRVLCPARIDLRRIQHAFTGRNENT